MKTNILILTMAILLLIGCAKKEKNQNNVESSIMGFPNYTSLNDTVSFLLNDYINFIDDSVNIVYQLFLFQHPDSILCYFTFDQYVPDLDLYKPSGFLKIKNSLVLFYNGADNFFNPDYLFIKRLKNELSKKNLKRPNELPAIYECCPWSCSYNFSNRRFIIDKRPKYPSEAFRKIF